MRNKEKEGVTSTGGSRIKNGVEKRKVLTEKSAQAIMAIRK